MTCYRSRGHWGIIWESLPSLQTIQSHTHTNFVPSVLLDERFSCLTAFYKCVHSFFYFHFSLLNIPPGFCLTRLPSPSSSFLSSSLSALSHFYILLLVSPSIFSSSPPTSPSAQLCRCRLVCSYLWGRGTASCMLKPNQLMLIKKAGCGHLFTQNTKLIGIARWNESHLLNWKIYFCPPCFNLGGGVEVNLFFYKIYFLY